MGIKKDTKPDPNAAVVRRIVIQARDTGDGIKLDTSSVMIGAVADPESRNIYAEIHHIKTAQGKDDELIQSVELSSFTPTTKTRNDLEKALAKLADEIAASFFDIAPANELVREGQYYKEKKKA